MELEDREWVTAKDAALMLAVSVETVETLAMQRILRSYQDGDTLYVEPLSCRSTTRNDSGRLRALGARLR